MSTENRKSRTRARTLRWTENIDEMTCQLAAERGVPVNKFLEELVREEWETPRLIINIPSPGYAELIRASQKSKTKK